MMARAQFWFFFPLRVRYSEIDGQKVVFHAHYLTYFDTAITEYMRVLRYDTEAAAKQAGVDFHVVRALVEFKAPIRFDDEIEVAVRTGRLGRSSLTFALAIFMKGSDELLAEGEIVWVHTDQQTRRAVPVPEALRQAVTARESA
jgi:acyl-CoA thioester hydrolase